MYDSTTRGMEALRGSGGLAVVAVAGGESTAWTFSWTLRRLALVGVCVCARTAADDRPDRRKRLDLQDFGCRLGHWGLVRVSDK